MRGKPEDLGASADADRASGASHGVPTGLHHTATVPLRDLKPRKIKLATNELRRAYEHGRRCASRGQSLRDNPYRPCSDGDLWRAWNSGFADKGTSKDARKRRNRRNDIIAKHGEVCWLCLKPITNGDVTLDHVAPRSKGGRTSRDNLRPAHAKCNRKRGNGPPPELLLTAEMMLERQLEAA